MPLILGANSLAGGYQVKNSLRFNSGSSDYLNRTFTTPTNRKIFTFSTWLKKTKNGDYFNIFSANHSTTYAQNWLGFSHSAYDDFAFNEFDGSSYNFRLSTTQLFRDVSAFYHILVAVDTTQATASNRIKIYVNGTQITSFVQEIYPSQNFEMKMNSAVNHAIGTGLYYSGNLYYLNAYLAETFFIDGQQLTPSSFGETDTDTGIWKPKAYTGTFGTNGFYLDFEDSANLGNDMSGNNNDFTVNNLTSIDQTTDTPTNNFCTLNPNNSNSALATLSQGNTVYTGTSGDNNGIASATFGLNGTGKWYWEAKIINASTGYPRLGVIIDFDSVSQTTRDGGYATSQMFPTNVKAVGVARGSTTLFSLSGDITITAPANNDIIQFAVDRDNGAVYIGNNGTWYNSGVPTSGASRTGAVATFTASGTTNMFVTSDYNGSSSNLNFGNPSYTSGSYTDGAGYGNFSYAVPSGYYSLCTKNLAQFG